MKTNAVRFYEIGGPEVLRIENIDLPTLEDDEVVIDVEAFSINRADILFIHGHHYTLPQLPSRIGSEAAGRIRMVGKNVTRYKIGEKVCTVPHHNTKYGVQGEQAIMHQDYLAPWPDNVTAEQATSIWMQMLTAYYPIVEISQASSEDFVLIGAGSSSAALGAIRIAKDAGACVIATTRTGDKSKQILAAGADHVISTDSQNLATVIMEITGGRGVRVIYDPIGGGFYETYLDAMADNAIIFLYGLLSGIPVQIDVVKMVQKAAILHPYSMFNHVRDSNQLKRGIEYITHRLKSDQLIPTVDSVFTFNDVVEAYRYMEAGKQVGKIVVRITLADQHSIGRINP